MDRFVNFVFFTHLVIGQLMISTYLLELLNHNFMSELTHWSSDRVCRKCQMYEEKFVSDTRAIIAQGILVSSQLGTDYQITYDKS